MDRPFASKRPIGPLAQMGDDHTHRLGIIVNYDTRIPDNKVDAAVDAASFHFDAHDIDIINAEVGPENEMDSVMITTSDMGLEVDDVQSAASASVAEFEDQGIDTGMNAPMVEIVLL